MSEIVMRFKGNGGSAIPFEAEAITPDRLREMSRSEIERLPIHHGKILAISI